MFAMFKKRNFRFTAGSHQGLYDSSSICSMIGKKNAPCLGPISLKLHTRIPTWGTAVNCVRAQLHEFPLTSYWLSVISSFFLIGLCVYSVWFSSRYIHLKTLSILQKIVENGSAVTDPNTNKLKALSKFSECVRIRN